MNRNPGMRWTQSVGGIAVVLLLAVAWNSTTTADDAPPAADAISLEDRDFFETSVRPVLINRCQDCHSSDNRESQLSVEHLADLLAGGSRGPAIVPGEPPKSLLIRALSHGDVELQMPPKEKLPAEEIAAITEWVRRGAPWPGEVPTTAAGTARGGEAAFTSEQLNYWSFQPIHRATPPAVERRDWVRNPIDQFVLSGLEQLGMDPAPAADRRTLIRRVYFDLLGIPPTPDVIEEFVNDDAPDAYARLIESCLASPHYGERWGRYWLDIARYSDSNGLDENLAHAHAYRYRDYVVAALNSDTPYDVFIHEQLAGDLLNADSVTATTDYAVAAQRVTATGFLSLGAKMLAEDDPVKMQMDIIDEQVDTLARAFMGLTFGCARCHDHKFDPVSQGDYYAMAGIFKSTRTMENFSVVARWQELPLGSPDEIERQNRHKELIAAQNKAISEFIAQQNAEVLRSASGALDGYLLAAQRAELRAKMIADAQPQGPSLSTSTELPAGVRLLEAEQFHRGNVGVHSTGYGEGIGVLVNQGPTPNFVEYDIEVPQASFYQLEIRHAAAESRPSRIALNAGIAIPEALTGVTGSWYPDTQEWVIAGFVELRAGTNTLRIERDGPFSHIDKLLLVPLPADAAASLAAEASSAGEVPLQSVFIDQWRKLLTGSLPADSPLVPAQRAFQGLPPEQWFADVGPELAALFGDPQPATFVKLAQKYLAIQQEDATTEENASAVAAVRQAISNPQGPFELPATPDGLYPPAQQAQLKQQREALAELEKSLPALPETMAVSDATPEDLPIHYRGSHLNLGPVVSRQVPAIFRAPGAADPLATTTGSGRMELARWLTRPDHPLTSRVMVNRVWLWHFGRGLVRSPDNFGLLGETPTHAELLDWLATEFRESGWSLKDLHRLIMSSATYQMSTAFRADYDESDPENKLLWRMNRRRLDAEAIRDAILAVSGSLDDQMQGTQLTTANRAYVTSTASVNPAVYDSHRRSLYLPVVRSALYEMFQAFDFADPSVLNGQRDSTTVASQALFMMNSQIVAEESSVLAADILKHSELSPEQQLALLFERILGRVPTPDESTASLAYINDYAPAANDPAVAWHSLARLLISSNEFLYIE
ncbi:MAG: DUF1553 domain-containing protein [Planctomycetaceae bacterium]|nr:DUF1553 domain-containing protein [Planctomycetaceae bacterium]